MNGRVFIQPIINYAICAVSAYLIGSLSFGIIISKLFYHKDISNFGSKSAGMTNMLRTFGKAPAIATFICDVGEGAYLLLFWQKNCLRRMLTHWSADILLPSFQYSVICFLSTLNLEEERVSLLLSELQQLSHGKHFR